MVLAKSSRKNKKAWRRNIDTTEELEALVVATEEARQGTAVASLQDQQLFYVDTAPKTSTKAQAILQAAHRALPVHMGPKRRPKGPAAGTKDPSSSVGRVHTTAITTTADPLEAQLIAGCSARVDVNAADPWAPTTPCHGWDAVQPATARPAASQRKRTQSTPANVAAAALEVDAAGCSFNPEEEAHQDALAVAVAAEVAKDVQRVLDKPAAPPKRVDYAVETDELALLQVDAVTSEEEEEEEEGRYVSRGGRQAKATRKTQRDLNKAKRRREQEAIEAKRQALKKQRRDIDALAILKEQLELTEQARAARRVRLAANRQHRAMQQPPKLGPVPFVPEPVHVMLSEEVNGSLRTVKAAPMVLRDRYKSLQRRGVIEPRLPAKTKVGKRVAYVHGSRAEAALEREAEIATIRTQNKQARRASKRAAPR